MTQAVPKRRRMALPAEQWTLHGAPNVAVRPRYDLLAGLIGLALLALALLALPHPSSLTALRVSPAIEDHGGSAGPTYGKLPLSFIPNRGQTDGRVRYFAQGPGFGFYFTSQKAVMAFQRKDRGVALDLRFLGASSNAALVPTHRGRGTVNYIQGDDPAKWRRGLPSYGGLAYEALWPGIDMRFRGAGGALKYAFRVGAGASANRIRLAYAGADSLALGEGGNLLIRTPLGSLRDSRPRAWQRIGSQRVPVRSRFTLTKTATGAQSYGFALGGYDHSRPLVIDPGITYSTYLGGSGTDLGNGIAIDSAGSAYVTGRTTSGAFPTSPGAYDTTANGAEDVFVTKLSPDGSSLVYSTLIGGAGAEESHAIAVDAAGNAYVTGETTSSDYPTTAGAFDTAANSDDGFVTKLDASGSTLAYSAYLGGSNVDYGEGITVDDSGNAYVAGYTGSANFPTTAGAFDTTYAGFFDVFLAKVDPSGSALTYSTYLGGSDTDTAGAVAVDSTGSAYVTGGTRSAGFPTTPGAFDTTYNGVDDIFVTKVDPTGSTLAYSTLAGSSNTEGGSDIAIDGAGNAYVTGYTNSSGFPATAAAFDTTYNDDGDAYVMKLNTAGSALAYSTFLGGTGAQTTGYDAGLGIDIDPAGDAYITGRTDSVLFPTTPGAYDTIYNGVGDVFVTELDPLGASLIYSTYVGGSGTDVGEGGIEVDRSGGVYVAGYTTSSDYPTTGGAFDTSANGTYDAFVTKLDLAPYTSPVGASPARLSLVPTSAPCEVSAADSMHGAPLAFQSCHNPKPTSTVVTVGPKSLGFVRFVVCNTGSAASFCNPSGMPKPDLRLTASLRDVKCVANLPAGQSACPSGGADYNPNGAPGPYTQAGDGAVTAAQPPCFPSGSSSTDCLAGADLTETAALPGTTVGGLGTQFEGHGIRVTDRDNGPSETESATMVDIGFPIPIDCIPTSDPSVGSTCGTNTTANALVPGVIQEGKAAIWQLGEVQIVDSGPDGVRGNADDQVLAAQGVFLP